MNSSEAHKDSGAFRDSFLACSRQGLVGEQRSKGRVDKIGESCTATQLNERLEQATSLM